MSSCKAVNLCRSRRLLLHVTFMPHRRSLNIWNASNVLYFLRAHERFRCWSEAASRNFLIVNEAKRLKSEMRMTNIKNRLNQHKAR